jgi:3-deoxy-D-manno-octulosonic-acid transferase
MLIYNLLLKGYSLVILLASPFNAKAKNWIEGRKDWKLKLSSTLENQNEIIWFHAASLGEAEQGLPIIESLKKSFPNKKILLSFFSPSGFENFKKPKIIDFICYLPQDSRKNAKDFISIAKPELVVFIKYEIWVHYFNRLHNQNIPLILAPALFRKNQIYFKKPFSNFFLKTLKRVNHIFVQDENSFELLKQEGFNNISICGETRLDRVLNLSNEEFIDSSLDRFCGNNQKVLIVGSSWPEEEKMISSYTEKALNLKVILAPHDVSPAHLNEIRTTFSDSSISFYSEQSEELDKKQVLIIDNIGMLSRLYRYGDIAFIGGGYGAGLHSTVEAAAYGMPILFGPNHKKFIEPREMIMQGFGFEIQNQSNLELILSKLLTDEKFLKDTSQKAKEYVVSKSGASKIIHDYLFILISNSE